MDQVLTQKKAIFGPSFDSTADMYIYIYMLWSYYLGHVWGILMVTNWATFVFFKRLFGKNAIKIGASADFCQKNERAIFNGY